MRKLTLILATCALAACKQTAPAPAPSESAAPAPTASATTADMAGTYDYTYKGKPRVTVMKADGSYQDSEGGKVVESGTWSNKDGKTCFDDKKDPAQCWTTTTPDASGKFTATSADGKTVLQITKRPA
ncbi:MAG TPA: hypothetical protein VIC34_04330 [Croceibacterium sp.]